MKRIAILSDTHLSSETLPEWVKERIQCADYTIHAGDIDTTDGIDQIRELSNQRLTVVRGNWDSSISELPVVTTVEIEDVTFVITHGTTGQQNDYAERVATVAKQEALGTNRVIAIGGHTHRVMDTKIAGIRLLNPGSATGVYPATDATMLLADVDESQLSITLLEE